LAAAGLALKGCLARGPEAEAAQGFCIVLMTLAPLPQRCQLPSGRVQQPTVVSRELETLAVILYLALAERLVIADLRAAKLVPLVLEGLNKTLCNFIARTSAQTLMLVGAKV
jgi:hypothetical protein